MDRSIYVIGSMRNLRVPEVAKALRNIGLDAFDDWYSPGEQTDDKWQEYERARGRSYREALAGHHAQHAFAMDKQHLDRCSAAILVAPAGKSGHLELGYMIGRNRDHTPIHTYILIEGDHPVWDLMYRLATGVVFGVEELLKEIG